MLILLSPKENKEFVVPLFIFKFSFTFPFSSLDESESESDSEFIKAFPGFLFEISLVFLIAFAKSKFFEFILVSFFFDNFVF